MPKITLTTPSTVMPVRRRRSTCSSSMPTFSASSRPGRHRRTGQGRRIWSTGFPNSKVLSGEFTDDALDHEHQQNSLWLALETDDPEGLQQKVIGFGAKRIVHPYTPFFYFQAPGGQVFTIVEQRPA